MAELGSGLVPVVITLTILSFLVPKLLVLYRQWNHQSYGKGESVYDAEVEPDKVDVEVIRESEFPEDWWTSDKLFKLEARAIFCKVSPPISTRSLQALKIADVLLDRHGSASSTHQSSRNLVTITLALSQVATRSSSSEAKTTKFVLSTTSAAIEPTPS